MAKRVNLKSALTNGIKNVLMVEGKSSRSEHWYWFAFYILGSIAAGFANPAAGAVFFMVFFIPTLSMHVRRIHDTGHSGFWLLLPPVATVFLLKKSATAKTKWSLPTDAIVSVAEMVEVLDDNE